MSNRTAFFLGIALLSLTGCMTDMGFGGETPQTSFVSAEIEKSKSVEYVPVPIPVAKPYFKKLPGSHGSMVKAHRVSPEKAIENARKAALQKSTSDGFINAMQVFDYMPGALYEVYSSPGYITSIILKPGERLIAKTSGDTVRWIMGETTMGSGREQRTVLIVKPLKANLSTNMMVTTDQRIYMLEMKSVRGGVYNASVTWNYPQDDFKDLASQAAMNAAREEQVIAGQVNLSDLNYNYKIESVKGGSPDWLPVEAFDDGNKTYIRFPDRLGKTKAPVLYVLSGNGDTEIVNYRVRGNFYVIDRIIHTAELRIGSKRQQIVRVTREEPKSFFGRLFGGDSTDRSDYNG